MTLHPLGDAAVVLELARSIDDSTLARVRAVAAALTGHRPIGVTDVVPAFGSVTVYYDPWRIGSLAHLCEELMERAARVEAGPLAGTGRLVEIPVCYGGELGPDLPAVAQHARLSEAEVVALHSSVEYRVHAIGFAPGFPYLGGLPPRLHTPRRATPRPQVAAGSVGIGSAQTGVYPLAGPGGWNLIGRTPQALFRLDRAPAALLAMGDRVTFRPISREEFAAWK